MFSCILRKWMEIINVVITLEIILLTRKYQTNNISSAKQVNAHATQEKIN